MALRASGCGIESLRKTVEINPNSGALPLHAGRRIGACRAPRGAAEVCAVARCLAPIFTIARFRAEAVSDNPVYLAQRGHFYEGLRLAGVPEG